MTLFQLLILLFTLGVDLSVNHDSGYTRFGYLALGCLAVSLVMGSGRNSVMDLAFGIGFERGLVWHRWVGVAGIGLVAMHGALYLRSWMHYSVVMDNMWDRTRIFHGLVASLLMFLMFLLSLPYIRRRLFSLFYFSHLTLFPLILIFINLHTPHALPYTVIPISLYILDRLLRFAKASRPVSVVSAHVLHDGEFPEVGDGDDEFFLRGSNGGGVRLRICAPPLCRHHGDVSVSVSAAAGGVGGDPSFSPGQYVFVNVPEVDGVAWHPVSIASAPPVSVAAAELLRRLIDESNVFGGDEKGDDDDDEGGGDGGGEVDGGKLSKGEVRIRRLFISPQGCGVSIAFRSVGGFTRNLRNAISLRTHPLLQDPSPTTHLQDPPPPTPPQPPTTPHTYTAVSPTVQPTTTTSMAFSISDDDDDEDDEDDDATTLDILVSEFDAAPVPKRVDTPLVVRVEGPYGRPMVGAREFPGMVCVAGGVGVTPLLGFIGAACGVTLERLAAATTNPEMTLSCRTVIDVTLVWVVRDPLHVLWFLDDLMVMGWCLGVDVRVYVTGASEGIRRGFCGGFVEGLSE
ncbi:hypothetical protein HDU67_009554, partial [Dinochytrium kinnereticum]